MTKLDYVKATETIGCFELIGERYDWD